MSVSKQKSSPKPQEHLGKALAVDAAAATTASFFLAPFITAVDVSIIRNANGSMKLWDSLRSMLREATHPRFFARRDFLMVWFLYMGTYATANMTKTLCRDYAKVSSMFSGTVAAAPALKDVDVHTPTPAIKSLRKPGSVSDIIPTQVTTTGFNMSVCIYKDRLFTKWFGTRAAGAVPLSSMSLWAIRDSLTVAAGFTLVDPVGRMIAEKANLSQKTGNVVSQLLCPVVIQYVSTPLHLLGLDLYNNPASTSGLRMALLRKEYVKSVLARQMRIGFSFGIGGVGNRSLHESISKFMGVRTWSVPN